MNESLFVNVKVYIVTRIDRGISLVCEAPVEINHLAGKQRAICYGSCHRRGDHRVCPPRSWIRSKVRAGTCSALNPACMFRLAGGIEGADLVKVEVAPANQPGLGICPDICADGRQIIEAPVHAVMPPAIELESAFVRRVILPVEGQRVQRGSTHC